METFFGGLAATVVGIAVLVGTFFLLIFGVSACKDFNRTQKRKDATNEVKITAIQIQNQAQRVKIAQQKAQIRFENAKGVREAQDEIAKTLTPLYVQFEMVDAIRNSNASTIYIPTDPSTGLPVVTTRNSAPVGK